METLGQEVVLALQESPLWAGMQKEEQAFLFLHTCMLWVKTNEKFFICFH